MAAKKRVFVAGHAGMVGSAIVRALSRDTVSEVLTSPRGDLDLTRQDEVDAFFAENEVDEVYLAAAKVGGIHANNSYPVDFIRDNLRIQLNLIDSAHRFGVKRLLFLGSSCIYPRDANQPMPETALLAGPLEPTNEPYAVAKIAGIKLCESYRRQFGDDFRSVMPTNLYGPHDNFDLENSHVIPALMRRVHEAKVAGEDSVVVWGSGTPRREFLHVDDLATACLHLMDIDENRYWEKVPVRCSHINIGTGEDCSIRELALAIGEAVGFEGNFEFDTSRPDGPPRKLLDVSKIHELGWRPSIHMRDGLADTYRWYVDNLSDVRGGSA